MNLPNKISMIRLFLVPFILLILYSGIENSTFIATVIFVIAAATDALDGYIARRRKLITTFGKFIDPLVDKMLVVTVLIYLVYKGIIPDWMVIIIIGRDFAVLGLRILSASQNIVIAASKFAKLKTVSQMFAVVFALLTWPLYWWIMLLSVILTVITGADYLWKGRKVINDA